MNEVEEMLNLTPEQLNNYKMWRKVTTVGISLSAAKNNVQYPGLIDSKFYSEKDNPCVLALGFFDLDYNPANLALILKNRPEMINTYIKDLGMTKEDATKKADNSICMALSKIIYIDRQKDYSYGFK